MENHVYQMPRIGDKAPDFTAKTTIGDLTLSEYGADSWVVMFSHPADFTPVCTTELTGFATDSAWFAERNTKLIGVSIDTIHSHLAWVKNVRDNFGILMEFPIVADINMHVAQLYGMIHPGAADTATVRAVFFIDPAQTIRLIMYYPLNVGRNMAEIKRVLTALQTADQHKVALPLNWVEGEKAIVPAPKTLAEMEDRMTNPAYEKIDFYLAKKSIS